MSENAASTPEILMFGADWCVDCRRAKRVFDDLHVPYRYIDLEATPEAAEVAYEISGRTNIPVITYPDGTHHVEPRDIDMRAKLSELGLA